MRKMVNKHHVGLPVQHVDPAAAARNAQAVKPLSLDNDGSAVAAAPGDSAENAAGFTQKELDIALAATLTQPNGRKCSPLRLLSSY